jgi:hypothetical protein
MPRQLRCDDAVHFNNVRVTDAKEVGVGNPAEETFCHPDTLINAKEHALVKPLRSFIFE